MLVVVAIIGIVMLVAIPSIYRGLNPDAMQKAVSDIMEACRHARAYAILQSVATEMVFRADDGAISIRPVGSAGRDPDSAIDESPGVPEPSVPMPTPEARPDASAGVALSFSAKLSDKVAVELIEVNFQDQMEFEEARVRFHPNGTSDEFKMLLYRPDTGERRLITVEVVTGLVDVESDPNKMR
jgi:hypothetical protein